MTSIERTRTPNRRSSSEDSLRAGGAQQVKLTAVSSETVPSECSLFNPELRLSIDAFLRWK
eukprot:3516777-Amphidinium_carterae.1